MARKRVILAVVAIGAIGAGAAYRSHHRAAGMAAAGRVGGESDSGRGQDAVGGTHARPGQASPKSSRPAVLVVPAGAVPQPGTMSATPSLSVSTPAGAPAPSAERVTAATRQWQRLSAGVRALNEYDQRGLDALYAQARDAIRADSAAMAAALARGLPGLVAHASPEESFFAVSAWIRGSQDPAYAVQAVLAYVPPADPAGADTHHPAASPAGNYRHLEAYGLRELSHGLARGTVSLAADQRQALIDTLTPRAAREKSLDASLEMIGLLKQLDAPGAVQTALAGHSERDRALIAASL